MDDDQKVLKRLEGSKALDLLSCAYDDIAYERWLNQINNDEYEQAIKALKDLLVMAKSLL